MDSYIVFKRDTPDAPPDYYCGQGQWSSREADAQEYDCEHASTLCDLLILRGHQNVVFVRTV